MFRATKALALATSPVLLTSAVSALGQTWSGLGVDNNYTTSQNWVGGVAPASNGTAAITFAGSVRPNPVINNTQAVASVTFNSATAFNVTNSGGSSLTLAGTGNVISVAGSGNAAIAAPVFVAGTSNFAATNANLALGLLSVGPSATLGLVPAAGRTIAQTGMLSLSTGSNIACSGGAGSLVQLTNSQMSYAISSRLQVTSGTVNFSGAHLTNPTISGTGALILGTSQTVADPVQIQGGGSMAFPVPSTVATVTMSGGGTLGPGSVTFTGSIIVTGTGSGSVISVSLTNSQFLGSAFVYGAGRAADLTISGLLNGNDLVISGTASPSVVLAQPYGSTAQGLTFNAPGGTLYLNTTAPVAPFGTISMTGDGTTLTRSSDLGLVPVRLAIFGRDIKLGTVGGPPITVDSLQVQGVPFTNVGTFAATSFTAASTLAPAVAFLNAGTASFTGTDLFNPGTITNAGSLTATKLFNAGTFDNRGRFNGTITNAGTFSVGSATAQVNGQFALAQGGRIAFNGLPLEVIGTLTLNGDLALMGNSIDASRAAVVNAATLMLDNGYLTLPDDPAVGVFRNTHIVSGDGTITGGTFSNAATWSVPNSLLLFSATLANTGGSFTLAAGATLTLEFGVVVNSGLFSLGGGFVNEAPVVNNVFTNTPSGQISGPGNINAKLIQQGILLATAGGILNIGGAFPNSGTVRVDAGGVLASGLITNTGRIQGDGLISSPVLNASGGRIQPTGTLTLALAVTNAAGGTVLLGTGNVLSLASGFAAHMNSGILSLAGGYLDVNGDTLTNGATGQITGFGTLTTAGLRNSGAVTLTGGTSFINGAVSNDAGKSFRIQYNPAIFTGFFTNNGNLTVTGTFATFAGGSSGTGPSPVPNAVGGGGSTVITAGSSVTADGVTQGSLIIQGALNLPTREASGHTPGTGRAVAQSISVLGTLEIDSGGSLDVQDNDVVVHSTPEAAIRGLIASGAIFSSLAGTSGGDALATIGDLANVNGMGGALYATFDGVSVVAGDVLVKYTYAGDTDLNGRVDASDLANVLAGMSGGLGGWVNGDVNHDGIVSSSDLGMLLASLRGQAGPFGDATDPGGSVPEPWMGLAVAAVGIRRVRR